MSYKLSMDEVNKLTSTKFVKMFRNVVEFQPEAAKAVVQKRPFLDRIELNAYFAEYLNSLSTNSKVNVLQSFPDLAGKHLDENELSIESNDEHISAGLDQLTIKQSFQMHALNAEYKHRFGFPFVICVRQNNRIECILHGIRNRLPNSRDQEVINGIEEVKKICQLRIENIVDEC